MDCTDDMRLDAMRMDIESTKDETLPKMIFTSELTLYTLLNLSLAKGSAASDTDRQLPALAMCIQSMSIEGIDVVVPCPLETPRFETGDKRKNGNSGLHRAKLIPIVDDQSNAIACFT